MSNGPNVIAPGADRLVQTLTQATSAAPGGRPPVHLWDPPYCGELDIRIASDGLWHYLGTPIGRPALAKLFASVLRRDDDDRYYLVTPVEKIGIQVDDAPFVAVDIDAADGPEGAEILFTTNMGDRVTLGPDAPLRLARDPSTDAPTPYVLVRDRLEARIDRKSFFRLVDLGAPGPDGETFGVASRGAYFPLARLDELDPEGP